MAKKIRIDDELIEKIMLCDPITMRGRSKLTALGLGNVIGPKEFFDSENGLWAEPVDEKKIEEMRRIDPMDPSPYVSSQIKYDDIKKRREQFNSRFSGIPGATLTLLMGVVGSGKSIEVQRRVFENSGKKYLPYRHDDYDGNSEVSFSATPNAILIDLEKNIQGITFGDYSYTCPKQSSPIWLFCTAVLDTLIYYIIFLAREHKESAVRLSANLKRYFIKKEKTIKAVGEKQIILFESISKWAAGTESIEFDKIFSDILNMLESKPTEKEAERTVDSKAAAKDTQILIKLLYLLSFCADPNEPKALIIDNIEDYIAVGRDDKPSIGVAVSNMQLKDIYDCLRAAQVDIQNIYIDNAIKRIDRSLEPSFSTITAIRRTSFDLLDAMYMGTFDALFDDVFDITGDTRIFDIWDRKKRILWDGEGFTKINFLPLKDQCVPEGEQYIEFADYIIRDTIGYNSLQSRYSRMLARGLRRVGHNESKSIYRAFMMMNCISGEQLPDDIAQNRPFISFDQYNAIKDSGNAAKYMLRLAFVEYYYQLQLMRTNIQLDETGKRWRNLNAGHLNGDRVGTFYGTNGYPMNDGETLKYTKVIYADSDSIGVPVWRSLLHRILCVLEKHPDPGVSKCIAPSFQPISLFDLMSHLFSNIGREPTDNEYGRLAEVLLAASKPERHGDYAPYVLMRIDPTPEGYFTVAGSLATTLKEIWKAGPMGNLDGGPFDWKRYGLRLSEAGKEFLDTWQPSFSFFASLYCCNQPPLFFIRSKKLIIHVLNKVYDYAKKVKDSYCTEAEKYLALIGQAKDQEVRDTSVLAEVTIQQGFKEIKRYITFRRQIREAHKSHIDLYVDYIDKCYLMMGITEEDKEEILSAAKRVKERYDRVEWKELDDAENENERKDVRACF